MWKRTNKADGKVKRKSIGFRVALAVFAVAAVLGFGLMQGVKNSCAQVVGTPPVFPTFSFCPSPFCDVTYPCVTPTTTTQTAVDALIASLESELTTAADTLENFIGNAVDTMTQAILEMINLVENNFIDWWAMMWSYDLRPSMQQMASQWNTSLTDQARTIASNNDANNQTQVQRDLQQNERRLHQTYRVSDRTCTAATNSGGLGRATGMGKNIRKARQVETNRIGTNRVGAIGDDGVGEYHAAQWNEYVNRFCDPTDNNGNNACTTPGGAPNADVRVTDTIYNETTIDVTDPDIEAATRVITENLTGSPAANPVMPGAVESSAGKQKILERRSYLARLSALRSVPLWVQAQRMPGSRGETWMRPLREAAGVPPSEVSTNPSYREIMHAMIIDRFNDGKFATKALSDETEVEMEKLMMNSFYLMQLRDYYELMERMALTLAVQTAMMVDQQQMPDALSAQPME